MAKKRAAFDLKSVKLIEQTVERVRHMPLDDGKWPSKRPGIKQNHGFWAQITAKEPSGWKYSWKKLEAKDDGKLDENEDYPSGEYGDETMYAVEARYRSKWVLKDEVVWLTPSLTQPYFVFSYRPDIRHAKLVSAGTIAKGTASTPGKGTATLRVFDSEDETFSDGEEITVYNSLRSEVIGEPGEEVFLHIKYGEGVWWLVSAECVSEDTSSGGSGGSS